MTTTANYILQQVSKTLQDPDQIRWNHSELAGYLNDGQVEIVAKRPDLKASRIVFTPVAGADQQIPSDALVLMDIPNNAAGRKRSITKVDQLLIDAVQRDWQSMPPALEFVHFMHDLREPRKFLLYPPARIGGSVVLLYSAYPTAVTVTGTGPYSAQGNIDIPDEFANALRDYVLFRAYSKDAEFGGNAQMSASYFQLFNAAIGEQLQSSATVAPKS